MSRALHLLTVWAAPNGILLISLPLASSSRRAAEYSRMTEASTTRFSELCTKRRLGKCGRDDIRQRLIKSLAELRPLYVHVATLCQADPLPHASAFYIGFVRHSLEKAATPADSGAARDKGRGADAACTITAEDAAAGCLVLLKRAQALDLSSVSMAISVPPDGDDCSANVQLAVDWGDGEGAAEGNAAGGLVEVDWGRVEGDEAVVGGTVEVNWGDDGDEEGAAEDGAVEVNWGDDGGGAADGGAMEVNWGDDSGAWVGEIEIEADGNDTSAGELTLATLFEDDVSRNQLIDDLLELQCFLRQRAVETAAASTESLSADLQLDTDELDAQLRAVDGALECLDNDHTRHLLMLDSSSRYMDRQEQVRLGAEAVSSPKPPPAILRGMYEVEIT